ncbi:hypothetical protein [Janibacter anophelis]|uniref:hypothetical protein n=1 Tax=Janibacter anophelis TaxID=319054 RepID=UPI00082DF2FE
MKRRELLKALRAEAQRVGLRLEIREGGSHTKVSIGERSSVVPRHSEINEMTALAILKQMGVRR